MADKVIKFYFSTPPAMRAAANPAAYDAGLTSASEYLRIALQYLIEHRQMPPEFKGMRSVRKHGRSVSLVDEATQ